MPSGKVCPFLCTSSSAVFQCAAHVCCASRSRSRLEQDVRTGLHAVFLFVFASLVFDNAKPCAAASASSLFPVPSQRAALFHSAGAVSPPRRYPFPSSTLSACTFRPLTLRAGRRVPAVHPPLARVAVLALRNTRDRHRHRLLALHRVRRAGLLADPRHLLLHLVCPHYAAANPVRRAASRAAPP